MAPESAMCESHFAREIMSLLKWIKVKKPVLPSSSTHAYSNALLKPDRMKIDYIMHCCALLMCSQFVGCQI